MKTSAETNDSMGSFTTLPAQKILFAILYTSDTHEPTLYDFGASPLVLEEVPLVQNRVKLGMKPKDELIVFRGVTAEGQWAIWKFDRISLAIFYENLSQNRLYKLGKSVQKLSTKKQKSIEIGTELGQLLRQFNEGFAIEVAGDKNLNSQTTSSYPPRPLYKPQLEIREVRGSDFEAQIEPKFAKNDLKFRSERLARVGTAKAVAVVAFAASVVVFVVQAARNGILPIAF